MKVAALGRTLNRIARFDMRSNPRNSKEREVLNVTHNSVSNLLTFYRQCLEGSASAEILSSKLQDSGDSSSACSLRTMFWKKEKDGASSLTSSW